MTPEEKQKKDQDGRLIAVLSGAIVTALCAARLIAVYFFDAEVSGTHWRYGNITVTFYWVGLVCGVLLGGVMLASFFKHRKK